MCQKDFWNNFSFEIKKIYKFNFDDEYKQQYKKLLEDDTVDITDIIIPKITKKFEEILTSYIQENLEKIRKELEIQKEKSSLFPLTEELKKQSKNYYNGRLNNGSTRNRKK